MKQPETKQKVPWPQTNSSPGITNSASASNPSGGMKPIIRPSTRLGSRAQIPTRPAFLSKTSQPTHVEAAPPQVADAVEQFNQNREAKAADRAEQISQLAKAIEKSESQPEQKPLIRLITIPDVPMVKIVGHSVRGTKVIPYPSMLPEITPAGITNTLGKRVFVPLLLLVATSVIGWNALRQDRPAASGEIIDQVSHHAMAPNRNLSNAYDEEPTRLRAKLSGIAIHNGPGPQFSVIGNLKADRLYPILEQNSNWIKIATDQTHFAWVNQGSVELIR